MIVSMWMTRNVETITPHTPITEAAEMMALKRIRRLPIVEEHVDGSHLVGLVSAKDILHAFPPNVNPFAVGGLESRSAGNVVAHIMSRHLHTASPDMPVEEAAAIMAENKIGALPVLREKKLVGLITESDIFRAFTSFFTPPDRGARITFDVSQGEDIFGWLNKESQRRHFQVLSLISSRQENAPVCVVRIAGETTDRLLEDIWNSGHRVINVIRYP
jgi:acetoin utilization protein AcuB